MAGIRISPDEVHQVAIKFEQAGSQSQEIVSTLQSTMSNLQPQWEGLTKERFYQEFEQWRSDMNRFVDLLGQIGQELHGIAERFAAADQQK
ncbi:MAG: WXG100 family type VII secretion target [Chloroflexi bacterium]|nr:WXG100 family type VII secretion target [Chloroflexota bacterium]